MSNNEKSEAFSFYLTCDECGHNVDFEGDMTREHIGYPCPRCAANMLTEEDYIFGAEIMAANKIMMEMGWIRPASSGAVAGEGEQLVRIHHHAGKTTIEQL